MNRRKDSDSVREEDREDRKVKVVRVREGLAASKEKDGERQTERKRERENKKM